MSVPEITVNEIEMIAVIIRGILIDPDVVNDSRIETIIQMLEMVGSASEYAHYPVTLALRTMYMDALTGVINKIFHSYKSQRIYRNTTTLAKQQSIAPQYLRTKGSIIRGVSQRMQLRQQASAQTGTAKQQQYQQWGRRFDKQMSTFINHFMPKMSPIFPVYNYTSNAFMLQI